LVLVWLDWQGSEEGSKNNQNKIQKNRRQGQLMALPFVLDQVKES
jgi:hypothetical protein